MAGATGATTSKAFKAARALTRNAYSLSQNLSSNTAHATASTSTSTNLLTPTSRPKPRLNLHPHPHPMATVLPPQLSPSNPQIQSAFQSPFPLPLPLARPITNTLCRKPIPNSYWATPMLVACEYPWAPSSTRPKLDALLASGVRTFIDLTESGELLQYQSLLPARASACGLSESDAHTIEYVRFPIPDRKVPESMEFLARIMAVLHECERRGRKAAVHCRGGIGRTGTVVGCWLVESGVARDGEDALRIIAAEWKTVDKCRRFPCSPETGPQFEFVRNFKKLPVRREDGTVEAQW